MSATGQDIVIDEEDRELLRELLDFYRTGSQLPEATQLRAAHAGAQQRLDRLESVGHISQWSSGRAPPGCLPDGLTRRGNRPASRSGC